jgi:hypothetical protein
MDASSEREKRPLESPSSVECEKTKSSRAVSTSEYDTLPVLEAGAAPISIGHEAILESQVDETGLPPRMSTARMVVLAAGMMMTYFVGVSHWFIYHLMY